MMVVIHTVVFAVTLLVVVCPFFTESACPDIITRKEWNASDPKSTQALRQNPPPYVVIHHSVTRTCNTTEDCEGLVKSVQTYHMETNGWEDIGYNFLIGSDGSILEGRGWGIHGAHAVPYNARSIGICLLGNFEENEPQKTQLEAVKKLIECSVDSGNLTTDYHLIGHSQATATLCPGKYLQKEIEGWPHFDNSPQ